jgi:hypothetical protein
VKLPNAALRFKPQMEPDAVRAIYARYGIDPKSDDAQATRKHVESAVVWKTLRDGSIEPVEVGLGITDHAYTELTKLIHGEIKPGDDLVMGALTSKPSGPPGSQGVRH